MRIASHLEQELKSIRDNHTSWSPNNPLKIVTLLSLLHHLIPLHSFNDRIVEILPLTKTMW